MKSNRSAPECDVLFLALVIVSLGSGGLRADDWTSVDSAISVKQPDDSRFVQLEPQPPLTAIWSSKDESTKFGIAIVDLPRSMKLIQGSIEQGLAEEINGRIVESGLIRQGDHQVFTMTAVGGATNTPLYITQSVVVIGTKVYKAMAIGIGKDTRTDTECVDFIDSLKILPAAEEASLGDEVKTPQSADKSLTDQLSEKIGGISLLTLVICALLVIVSRISSKLSSGSK